MRDTQKDLAKRIIQDAAYQKCNLGTEDYIYLALEEAFAAGMARATFNGHPGIQDAPTFDEWIRIKAYESDI